MFNINLIKFISDKLKIKKEFILSSSLNIQKDRTKKIISILELVRAKKYLSPIGAKDYLKEDEFEKTKVELLLIILIVNLIHKKILIILLITYQ